MTIITRGGGDPAQTPEDDLDLRDQATDGVPAPVTGHSRAARRARRTVAVLTVVAVAASAIAVGLAFRVRSLENQLADARTTALASTARSAKLSYELDDARSRLSDTAKALSRRTAQRDELDGKLHTTVAKLERVNAQLEGTNGELDKVNSAVSVQVLALEVTKQCLTGVQRALQQASVDDFNGVVATLGSVESSCTSALSRSRASGGYAAVDRNFPDPYVLHAGDDYYGYATNGGGGTIQLVRGPTVNSLKPVGEALSKLPEWAQPGRTWAPSVAPIAGRYVMYYAVSRKDNQINCISRAVSDSPSGPFVDNSIWPILCQPDRGGSIDPSPFVALDGSHWLTWKSEGKAPGEPSRIWSQRLADDGLETVGDPVGLITAERPWEGGVVEGPAMVTHGDRYFLFYSANDWNTDRYAVGYAVCDTPQGPCAKPVDAPVVASQGALAGPGGTEFFRDDAQRLLVAYHAWVSGEVGYPNERRLYLAQLSFDGDRPVFSRRPVNP